MAVFRAFQENQPEAHLEKSYESLRKFGYALFAQNINGENPLLSPVSAYLALSMAGCGADGTTKEEFYKVLGRGMMVLTIDMMNTVPSEGDLLNISFANSAWIYDKLSLNDTWVSAIKCLMNAEVFQTQLSAVETMKIINHWISVKTNGLIKQVLEEPLDPLTRIALFNTVCFKGSWVFPFEPYGTHREAFYLNKEQNVTVQADMMSMCERVPGRALEYISDNFTEGVILPYMSERGNSRNIAFIALKPKGNSNIRNICSRWTSGVIKNLLAGRQKMEIELKLPRFRITFDRILNRSLANMGLLRCFDMKRADFARISRKARSGDTLYLNLVGQSAMITVDEEGTEAAAATELLAPLSLWQPQKKLYFNEPFLYMIMDMDKEIPLFIGILDNPEA
ncbi:MAG: hypothetical protein K2I96_19390 [Lachnospiraceae bacterium]|nr:hypothetical protein [Lachnospiraceae bacterium]